ncbi:dual specificity protein phosphatase Mpk3 isoform X2 [Chrysoperla carnea]|uniref:dual specificity protein phosphatase Mpk3 isoform X2 n=1 Tax=Chrysoperla carnea TaxID=189513 RepID=UPI001D061B5C|nr:dual specificity protein phosphatase Mpk3 isoform X2 [Chrysoperla carnea]
MPMTAETECEFITKEWLLSELRSNSDKIVILDCRSSNEYGESHIRDAVNFSIPSIMLRRLAAGKIDLMSTIKCRELKKKISSAYKENLFVLYNDNVNDSNQGGDSILNVLLRRLSQDGCRVVCLDGGFTDFRNSYPEWCGSCPLGPDTLDTGPGIPVTETLPLMGLRSLRISAGGITHPHHRAPHLSCDSLSSAANSSTDSSDTDERCDSSLGLEEDRDFPVEIVPHLYLGNAANSEDSQALARHSIQYVLNVTPDLPNVFEDMGNIKYMQIPIADHWSQNLASHFPSAIEFIEEARSHNKGILVHCLAGVSRSVTITVAYLMYKCSLNLNDAFNLVRSRKSNIAPNFHFMEQLHNFERELKLDVHSENPNKVLEQFRREAKSTSNNTSTNNRNNSNKTDKRWNCPACGKGKECKCSGNNTQQTEFLSPLGQIGVSPDSGIEFDRWGTAHKK